MLTLSTFQVCRESCYLNDNDKRDMIIQGLIYGSNSKQKIDEIMLVTNRIAKKTLLMNNIDEKVSLGVPEIRLYPPDYTEAFIDLVFRITNKPLCFYDILRYLDFVLFEYDLVDKVYDENKIRSIFLNSENLKVGLKTILHFICYTTDIPCDIFSLLR